MKDIQILKKPEYFFKEVLEKALRNQNVEASPEAAFYLVNLLSEFIQTEKLFDTQKEGLRSCEPLALKYSKALQEDRVQKIKLLKETGDLSLYVSGFFGESLNRSLVDITYYISMGETAYSNLSELIQEKVFREVFAELSGNFVKFVDILAEISHHSLGHSQKSLLSLYEQWIKTRSSRLYKLLVQRVILPLDPVLES
ncbi:MAG: hypothetical protein HYS98_00705 [Deltaproteobacteria bacterium]|nr:hypothetical protein [Deltaproteobacteria bacterium]